jgi:hypothetical protein
MRRRAYLSAQARAHLDEAAANYRRYRWLLDANEPDWALTLLFYSALHLIQAYAEQEATHPGAAPAPADHPARRAYVADRLRSISRAYRALQEASEDARYDLARYSAQEVREFHDDEYTRVREGLRARGIEFPDDPAPPQPAPQR